MINIILTIIITVLVYQCALMIIYFATGESEDKAFYFGAIVPALLLGVASAIYRKIRLKNAQRKYNCYQFYGEVSKKDKACFAWITNYYMTPEVASQFRQVGKDEEPVDYCIKLLREGKEFKSTPQKSDIVTAEMVENGFPGMSADFLKKFKIGA